MIPQTSPLAGYLNHRSELDAAIERVLSKGRYILGEETLAFEREFAAFVGTGYAVGVASGTDAIHLALAAVGVGPGDEVITVSHTAVATVAAVEMCSAVPVLVDIHAGSYTIDPDLVQEAVTEKTKAIVAVHLYGRPFDLEALLGIAEERHLSLVEDCAQSHGAVYHGRRTGAWGNAGAFSFYPTKNLGCLGDGGAVTTESKGLYERLMALRQYGWDRDRVSTMPGFNSRLDEIQAAILRVRLRHLEEGNRKRRAIAGLYNRLLRGLPLVLPEEAPDTIHVYHQYVARCLNRRTRDDLMEFLLGSGIQCAVHYPVPVHLQPGYKNRVKIPAPLSNTETVAQTILSLPLFPELSEGEVERIANAMTDFFSHHL